MRTFLILIAGLALASCATTSEDGDMASNDAPAPAEAPQETAPAETDTASNDDDPNRMVCRAERVTGQLRRERICRTAAQWAAIQEAGRDAIGRNQATGYQTSPQ
ncbi:hypothetical protein [Hyphobacterium indicum]|uniref:hypothetical protein n=1 Tax=Hyphobacterium indicum TaxID=2162714 RepID=UPI000F631C4E|nr:hypothetical protein [Hyphobacterium indicum]